MAERSAGAAIVPTRTMMGIAKSTAPSRPAKLSSEWTGLSPHLLATIYPVNRQGLAADGPEVVAPVTELTVEGTANWSSPFENSGTESKAPSITAMLQSGTLSTYTQLASNLKGSGPISDFLADLVKKGANAVADFAKQAQGRSGMTKLNSTQIFSGAPPLRLPMTLHFRAYKSPIREVHAPVDQLWSWFLAGSLAPDSMIANAFKSAGDALSTILPSSAPQMVGLRFGGFTFAPLVIESMSHPLAVERTFKGEALHIAVNLVLSSLTALDARDWRRAREGKPTRLSGNE